MQRERFRLGRYWLGQVSGSSKWYRFWYEPGAREVSKRSLGTSSEEAAKIALASIVLAEGSPDACEPRDVTLAAVFHRYWTEHSDHRRNPQLARRGCTLVLDFLGQPNAKVSDFTMSRQKEFIRHMHAQGYAVAYISRLLAPVSAALKRATLESEDGAEPLLTAAPPVIFSTERIAAMLDVPEPKPQNWHPTLAELARFLDACPDEEAGRVHRYAVMLFAFAGRPEAVIEARTRQLDTRYNLIAFNSDDRRQTKKYRPTVPVPEILTRHMAAWATEADTFVHWRGKPLTEVRDAWKAVREGVGLPAEFKPKSLRHFMATEMRRRRVPFEQREEWMGHRRRKVSDGYGQFSPDYLADAKACADEVLRELEALCSKPLCRQVAAKPGQVPGLQRFEPTTQIALDDEGLRTYSTSPDEPKVA